MKLIDSYNKELREAFAKHNQRKDEYAPVFFTEFNYMLYQDALFEAKRNRIKSKFHITNIEYIPSNIPYFSWPPTKFLKFSQKVVGYGNKTGMFKITCVEKGKEFIAIHCCFLTGFKNDSVHLVCCTDEVFKKLSEINSKALKKASKPPIGIYQAYVTQSGTLKYSKFKKNLSTKATYHKVKEKIVQDISHFYKNLKNSIENGEKGTRKVLLAGEQGTGKSSIIQEIIQREQFKNFSIVICDKIDALARHCINLAKYNIPSIAILEDCETFFSKHQEKSELLNFLSGPAEPKNTGGTYMFFTTNHPDMLSDRIKHRPERIDEIFLVSTLDENDALLVTEMYFGQFLPKEFNWETLRGLFTGSTGAEIMKHAQDVKREADFRLGGFTKVNKNFIKKVIDLTMNKYKKLEEINTSKTNLSKHVSEDNNLGFNFVKVEGNEWNFMED